ncbi:ABC1 kinase family protein [Roseibium limicola]|uniref:AarF/ABC1/UbiB kinase family protein n=1 Tax=Roseibium limicola TaxID=2816037 RepID=A0A939ER27_9HYPH|nr:AarF/ABC1/UbiB kinase family protein [Roseibium limicola]MBO0346948.1 AarF/ABC1/UbiB kinase family protein [Roseibium limicola]
MSRDRESNRLTARVGRYAKVGTNMGGIAAKMAGSRLLGKDLDNLKSAQEIADALGGLKGPLMKVAQLLSTVPDLLPPEYAAELAKLQASAPPMGWAFVKRRMRAELGPDWQSKFMDFGKDPAAAASLGQVHKATTLEGHKIACKLQYPDMASAVEADLQQLQWLVSLHRRIQNAIDSREIAKEIAARVREELDYKREAANIAAYQQMLAHRPDIRIPETLPELSTRRLLTMGWLEGEPILHFKEHPLEDRNRLAETMFHAWWHPFSHYGMIHGDPHLGNYTVFTDDSGKHPAGINLLDYGCIRIFPEQFVGGVVDLYMGLLEGDEDRVVHAYETWGYRGLTRETIDVLNIWARFIYGPLLTDRVRPIAEGISAADYGRKEAFQVHKGLKELGPVTIPQEFVFMDRAAIGLGSVFLHLRAELNFFRLFNEQIENFTAEKVASRQQAVLASAGHAQLSA